MSSKNIAITAGMISILTLISKLIGFIREMVMAGYYGTSQISDIYVLSNTIPTSILGSVFMAVATAYMPLLAEKDKEGHANKFTNQVITIMNIFALASVVLGCLCSGWLVRLFGYSWAMRANLRNFSAGSRSASYSFPSATQVQTSHPAV